MVVKHYDKCRNETLCSELNRITSRNRCNSNKIDLIKTVLKAIECKCYSNATEENVATCQ